MGKFSSRTTPPAPAPASPIRTVGPAEPAAGGGLAFARDAKSDLFLLASTDYVEGTFYEKQEAREGRLVGLARTVALADPAWLAQFVAWLRGTANIRSASLIVAVEAVRAWTTERPAGAVMPAGVSLRRIVSSALLRLDEPGEALAYWHAKYGRALPMALKRGVADAFVRLLNERSALRYDGGGKAYRLGDVIRLVHPRPVDDEQAALFTWLLDVRRGRTPSEATLGRLPVVRARVDAMALPKAERRALTAAQVREAGFSWETFSSYVDGPMDADAWERVLPSMPYMALVRNLRNLDEAGVSDAVAAGLVARIADPEQVRRSRMLPIQFLTAFREVPSLRWGHAIEQALEASLANVPALPGRTLLLGDMSYSMNAPLSERSTLARWDAAALFCLAFARKAEDPTVVAYSASSGSWTRQEESILFDLRAGEPLLRAWQRWMNGPWKIGKNTLTAASIRRWYAGHDRVIVVTDEEAQDAHEVTTALPADVPLFTWNVAGGAHSHAPTGRNRYAFGGLNDAAFGVVPLVESVRAGRWPWESPAA